MGSNMPSSGHTTSTVAADKAISSSDSATATSASSSTSSRALDGAALVPWLHLCGRCFLEWAEELQRVGSSRRNSDALDKQRHSGQETAMSNNCDVAVWSLQHVHEVFFTSDQYATLFSVATNMCDSVLNSRLFNTGFTAAGDVKALRSLLLSAKLTLFPTRTEFLQGGQLSSSLGPFVECLRAGGQGLAACATPYACNNPACSNITGPTELQLVSGAACVCGGCHTARYCCRDCQQQHWEHHRDVCRGLGAVQTAGAGDTVSCYQLNSS